MKESLANRLAYVRAAFTACVLGVSSFVNTPGIARGADCTALIRQGEDLYGVDADDL